MTAQTISTQVMTMKLQLILTFFTIVLSINIFAQTTELSHKETNNHEFHKNEIGVANSPVYFVKEKVVSYGIHIHYVRNILKSKFGLGLGFERIFDEHKHNTLGLVATFRPIEKLSFNVSPGLTREGNNPNTSFALHLETSYEFEIHNFHLGPVFEFAYDPEDIHISLGLHIGYGF